MEKRRDMNLDQIYKHLDEQDLLMNEILRAVKGDVSMGIDGIVQKQRDAAGAIDQLVRDVAHLQRWKKMVQDNRGKVTITFSQLFTRILAVIGGFGTMVGLLLGLKQLLEQG